MYKKIIICVVVAFLFGCESYAPVTSEKIEEDRSMKGTPVKLRAPAYDEMCAREPESVLCEDQNEDR